MSARQRVRDAVARLPAVDKRLRAVRRTDEIEALQTRLRQVATDVDRLRAETEVATGRAEAEIRRADAATSVVARRVEVPDYVGSFATWAPLGHFYSPIPDRREIARQDARLAGRVEDPAGVDANEDGQLAWLATLAELIADAELADEPTPKARYFANNLQYGRGDALLLQALLRHLRPKRYLEVGSGWSSAVALDTNEHRLDHQMTITCIEPYPQNLRQLVRADDVVEIIESPVQEVELDRFAALESGDVLFIDCSHVLKVASDVHHLVTRVLPVVPVGVYVHIHDIFWPFEYPKQWIDEGRAWNEAYLLHAFLQYNQSFEIIWFSDWLRQVHPDRLRSSAPALLPNPGAAIWLRRSS